MGQIPARFQSIDFWRGLALATIFINHIPGNVFERLTHRNFGFSDATEIFVLLAGIAAALAYLPRLAEGALAVTTFRILLRAFQLFMAHIVLVIACGAIVGYAVMATGDTRFLLSLHLDVLTDNTVPALVGLVSLGLQPAYLNILPLYIVMLLMAPPMLMLARRSPAAALTVSAALYLAAQLAGLALPTYPGSGRWFLNPFAWQLLFVAGICIGRALQNGARWRPGPVMLAASLAYLLVSLLWIRAGFHPSWDLAPLPRFLWEFDKTDLHAPRLLHALALAIVVAALPVEAFVRRNAGLATPFVMLGRHPLPVFCLGTVLAIAGQILRTLSEGALLVDSLLIAGGLCAQFALAGVLQWYRSGQKAASTGLLPRSS
jgi:hypothetical protein